MSVDFSHYSVTTATMVAAYVAAGEQPYDEMLLEAFERLNPPPLCPADRQAIVKSLGRERGRPTIVGRDRQALAERILGIEHEDVPRLFQQALSDRIFAGKGISKLEYNLSHHRATKTPRRDQFIRSIYKLVKEQIDKGGECTSPHVGRVETSASGGPSFELALEITHDLLINKFGIRAPAVRQIMNIVSKNRLILPE